VNKNVFLLGGSEDQLFIIKTVHEMGLEIAVVDGNKDVSGLKIATWSYNQMLCSDSGSVLFHSINKLDAFYDSCDFFPFYTALFTFFVYIGKAEKPQHCFTGKAVSDFGCSQLDNSIGTIMRLKNKIAVVTGSSRGIGREIALQFAHEGADIVVNYLKNQADAINVAEIIKKLGRRAIVCQANVSVRKEVKTLFRKAKETFGKIDILVNNAGINKRGWFDEATDEDWDMIMEVNLKGPFICCQEVFPFMKEQKGGRIINISSVAGQYHGPKTVHYAVSKAGLNSLTKVVARYGADHNILVNAVAPGIMLTDQTADELDSPAGQKIVEMTLLKRPGHLKDVAGTCVFLASDEQDYITGQVISVSGGAYLG